MSLESRLDAVETKNEKLRRALNKTIAAVEASLADGTKENQINSSDSADTVELEGRVRRLEDKIENLRQALSITIDTIEVKE